MNIISEIEICVKNHNIACPTAYTEYFSYTEFAPINLSFISYSEHLSVVYDDKNYGSLPYILFIASSSK